ncbi:MAG: cupin domain-containing protein [Acidimicrobiia bacterium]|jgi:quercetin dioxygenase-like cupin family protein
MSIQHAPSAEGTVVLGPGEGHHLSFLNNLATVKLSAGEQGSMSVVEFLAPKGFGPPEHRHNDEDELFIVLDGDLRFFTGGEQFVGGEGSFAHLPRAIPHTFQVLTESARFLNVTAGPAPRFDAMVRALGEPTDIVALPEPGYIDPSRVAEVCAAHGIDILGPPPPPPGDS